jgi:hypothetical protein
VADESDDRADEREVLTNLPRTRPARRSTRRTTAASEPKPKRAPAKPKPRPRPKVTEAAAPPPLPPAPTHEAHRSPLADVAVAGIELTGALFHFGISLTRAVLSATLGRVPRP